MPKARPSGPSPSASLADAREPGVDTEWALAGQLCTEGSGGGNASLGEAAALWNTAASNE